MSILITSVKRYFIKKSLIIPIFILIMSCSTEETSEIEELISKIEELISELDNVNVNSYAAIIELESLQAELENTLGNETELSNVFLVKHDDTLWCDSENH